MNKDFGIYYIICKPSTTNYNSFRVTWFVFQTLICGILSHHNNCFFNADQPRDTLFNTSVPAASDIVDPMHSATNSTITSGRTGEIGMFVYIYRLLCPFNSLFNQTWQTTHILIM